MATKRRSERRLGSSVARSQHASVFVRSPDRRVDSDTVTLVESKRRPCYEQGQLVHYWYIYHATERVGHICIRWIEDIGASPYASIDIILRSISRGRGIGTIAYRKACEQSRYDQVFATICKRNIASRIAAERAGFQPIVTGADREARFMWTRTISKQEGCQE